MNHPERAAGHRNTTATTRMALRHLLAAALVLLMGTAAAQNLRTKDGADLGPRSEFMKGCQQGVREKLIEMQGMKIDGRRYCQCMAEAFLPQVTMAELDGALQGGGVEQLMLQEPYFSTVVACVREHATVKDDAVVGELVQGGFAEEAFLRECERAAVAELDSTNAHLRSAVAAYCRCALDRLQEQGLTYGQLMEVENENSMAFNELVMPCVALLSDSSWTATDSTMVVEGTTAVSEVPLVDVLGRGYRVKLQVNGLERSFLFDTGASDLLINTELAAELRANGTLRDEHTLGTTRYELADGSQVKADKIRIDEIVIGEHRVRNVVAGVVEGGSLLCGRSLLDRFSKWEVDAKRKVLVLHR
ncbi:MAG: retropepsin-like aspartic protease [Flavobacteriales bacterium]